MGNKRMCGCVDVATGKRWIKSVDAKCRCVDVRIVITYIVSHEVVESFNHSHRN